MRALLLAFALLSSFAVPLDGTAGGMQTTAAAPAGGAAEGPARASLSLKSIRPLVVAGRGFRSGERVRIVGIGARRVQASTAGAFTLRLGGRAERCNGFSLVAIGSRGSRASLNFSQLHCPTQ